MSYDIGYVDNSVQTAHYAFLAALEGLVTASGEGWSTMRYGTSGSNHELILKGEGFSGLEEIYVGFRTYQDASADYYNLLAMVATGYVSGNTFDTQPNAIYSGIPAHNQRIDYWLTWNPQRIAFALKVGTPVYESCYVGKFLPYAKPSQFPYPVVCGGMLNGDQAYRFSNTGYAMPYNGNVENMKMRDTDGTWQKIYCYPFSNSILAGGTAALRDTGTYYPLMPVELFDGSGNTNLYGALDGIYFVPGFDNTTENTLLIDGTTYVVIQDVYRTGFNDFYALKMEA
jgi:hypothetical protein